MDNENQPILNQNPEPPKKFWQKLKLWQKISAIAGCIIVLLLIYIVVIPLLFCTNIDFDLTKNPEYVSCAKNQDCIPKSCGCLNKKGAKKFSFLTIFCGVTLKCVPPSDCECQDNKCVGSYNYDEERGKFIVIDQINAVFNTYLRAEENCDINLANSIITEKSKEIMHYTCSNMADERKCHINKTYKVLTKGDTAIIHFDDFSHKTGWPFFFAKENGEWKIDFYKMAFGIAMGGSGCDTGWSWRNEEIKNEFCGYFKEGECPEEIDSGIQKELSSAVNKTEFQINEEVKLTISNNFSEAIKIYNMSAEKFDNDEWKIVRYDISCPCSLKCEKFTPILSMNANRQFAWDQKETNCQKVGEGTYRFKIAWGPERLELFVPKISYSNEFNIN